MKKRNIVVLLSVSFILIFLFIYKYYTLNYTNEGITNKVLNQDGYALTLRTPEMPIQIFVKSEWIPFSAGEPLKRDIKVLETHSSNVILDVQNRDDDIYFSFRTTFNMDDPSGEFIYNGLFNAGGTFTYSPEEVRLYDKNMNQLSVGQTGIGPEASFSFGIETEEQKLISEGFYVKYDGYNVYDYSKK